MVIYYFSLDPWILDYHFKGHQIIHNILLLRSLDP